MNWLSVTTILCIYGFLKELRPIEPFLTPYLQSPLKNFTDEQLYSQVYPYWTYSYLVFLIPTFILTDLLLYKPIIILEGLTFATTWLVLLFGSTIGYMRLMQSFYGFATATEVAYFAYIFAAVDTVHYKKVTGYVKAAVELGDFSAYALSQVLVHVYGPNYQLLNYVSLASCTLIVPLAICLPWVSYKKPLKKIQTGTYLLSDGNDSIDTVRNDKTVEIPESYVDFVERYFICLWSNFKRIYSSTFMWKWSLWWALATCGYFQIANYIQNLWAVMQNGDEEQLNGIIDAANSLLSCITVVCVQFVNVHWEIWGEITLAVVSAVGCVLLLVMSKTNIIGIVYAFYILFTSIYQMMFTIGMSNIAKRLETESYGLVFGFNTFIALAIQTVLTLAVVDESGLALDIRLQFVVYGCYYAFIAVLFATMGVYTLCQHFRRDSLASVTRIEKRREVDEKTYFAL